MLKTYQYPKLMQNSVNYSAVVYAASNEAEKVVPRVLATKVADFLSLEFNEPVVVEITVHQEKAINPAAVNIRPLKNGIKAEVNDRKIKFTMSQPTNVKVDIDGLYDLFVFACAPEKAEDIPNELDKNVIFFKEGQVYEVGKLVIGSNQTVYIQGGAVVKGVIHSADSNNVAIKGRGVLDGSYFTRGVDETLHTVQFESCTDSSIEDITIIHPMNWVIVIGACEDIVIRNVKELGFEMSTDGVDICGCRNVLIEKCCFKVNDDCVVVKAFEVKPQATRPWNINPENIVIRDCIFGTFVNGAIMEIGHELHCEYVKNVVFEDIDVIGQHGFGSVFSIQNTGRADVSDITFKNIRIEHCYAKLINMRVMDSMYSRSAIKGNISGVSIRDIDWYRQNYNIGYTICTIGGMDKDHIIRDVHVEDFRINGEKIDTMDELYMLTCYAENITLK